MSTGRRLSANIGEIGAAIGAQLGIKPSSRPSSPGGRRASDASLPGSSLSLSFSRKSIQNRCSALQAQIVEKSSSKMVLVHGNLTVPGVPICFQHFVISVTDEILQLGMH